MTRACDTCRHARGVDCERPDALPEAWLAANEVRAAGRILRWYPARRRR